MLLVNIASAVQNKYYTFQLFTTYNHAVLFVPYECNLCTFHAVLFQNSLTKYTVEPHTIRLSSSSVHLQQRSVSAGVEVVLSCLLSCFFKTPNSVDCLYFCCVSFTFGSMFNKCPLKRSTMCDTDSDLTL